ncbi:unnamed protein product [Gemmataceae bacterium]|jgi:hypothetical protein|nr:unnamed protein product [Gemmataceae bacterium]VTU02400.1 unnamed protein product [Gemmataceae bacterium]
MFRTAVAALLFTFACSVTLYAEAAEEAPPPREGGDKKPGEGGKGKFGGGKFGGGDKGKFGGKFDPEKAKEFQEKLKNLDPEKLKELKEKFGGKFGGGKGKIDPEKLKELKEKFKKQD